MRKRKDGQAPAPNAFVDPGQPPGEEFCTALLSGPDYHVAVLAALSQRKDIRKKGDLARDIAGRVFGPTCDIDPEEVVRVFVRQPRQWASVRFGNITHAHHAEPADAWLGEFGGERWYGPIKDGVDGGFWYVRAHREPHYRLIGAGSAARIVEDSIRWHVVARVTAQYVALTWNNFTFSGKKTDLEYEGAFRFWMHVPGYFDELSSLLKAPLGTPDWRLHDDVLRKLWEKYYDQTGFRWKHLKIRAENAGVFLNASSSGAIELGVAQLRGLESLTNHLAIAAMQALGVSDTTTSRRRTSSAILACIIREWGALSYEFSLDKLSEPILEKLFRGHCYFGMKPDSKTQDRFPHVKCYVGSHDGSTGALKFLLGSIGIPY